MCKDENEVWPDFRRNPKERGQCSRLRCRSSLEGSNIRRSSLLVACRRDNVTADAVGRIGIFPLDLPELLHDVADSG